MVSYESPYWVDVLVTCIGSWTSRRKWTYLSRSHRSLRSLVQFFHGLGVVAEIGFAANEDDRQAGAEMKNLGDPL